MADPARRYTADEATALLPELTAALARMRAARQLVLAGAERIRAGAPFDGAGGPPAEYWQAMATLRHEVEAFAERGILLRDAESGLLDFPAWIDGQEAYLCWVVGEERVGHWHRTQAGFSGRRPLPG
jgi:hypothetical protein